MAIRIDLSGQYEIRNTDLIKKKAEGLNDPRYPFYVAMLSASTYESCLSQVGNLEVVVKGRKKNPTNGRDEIRYCRYKGWIVDKEAKS